MPLKVTNSRDGIRRVTVNVEFRMDAEMIATMVASSDMPSHESSPDAWADRIMKTYSNKALIDLVKAELHAVGAEVPYYRVGDNKLTYHVMVLTNRINNRMFNDTARQEVAARQA
jgi:hypothetical protein